MTVTQEAPAIGSVELYQQVQQYYARQMQLLDSGRVEEWAQTFTADGVFAANAHPEPTVGREAIAKVAGQVVADYNERRIQRRHWLGMVNIERQEGGSVFARCYALVFETPHGGQAYVKASTTCEDELVHEGGEWLVKHRLITRDDLI
ncbi:nuclear transport factor 2 family protein [Streptomyces sp. PTM05]|uniref:Nuclear transport factor 2 family protein n=1 Tax=Streptantibioticus parmotrematis TaxID=2873249 RepID=A0ABS7QT86_9ACTN|nr:nuclear transport factor 2 family protein [Streptantibioticus parmotrematis]MBY8886400.1 nuclear transport factor 2 family protein [Streptantibioticus parmotrematis]